MSNFPSNDQKISIWASSDVWLADLYGMISNWQHSIEWCEVANTALNDTKFIIFSSSDQKLIISMKWLLLVDLSRMTENWQRRITWYETGNTALNRRKLVIFSSNHPKFTISIKWPLIGKSASNVRKLATLRPNDVKLATLHWMIQNL